MGGPLTRTWFNSLVDDDGSGTTGTVWNKSQVNSFMGVIDAALAPLVTNPLSGSLTFSVDANLHRTTSDGADTGSLGINGGGGPGLSRGAGLLLAGNEHASVPGQAYLQMGDVAGAATIFTRRDGQHALYIDEAGQVYMSQGRVTFPATQSPSSDAYTLDDYREGAFLPTLTADGGASGVTYGARSGFFTKIGRRVTCEFNFTLANKGTLNGNLLIGGFPYVTAFNGATAALSFSGVATPQTNLILVMGGPGWDAAYIRTGVNSSGVGTLIAADITNATTFSASITYHATQ